MRGTVMFWLFRVVIWGVALVSVFWSSHSSVGLLFALVIGYLEVWAFEMRQHREFLVSLARRVRAIESGEEWRRK